LTVCRLFEYTKHSRREVEAITSSSAVLLNAAGEPHCTSGSSTTLSEYRNISCKAINLRTISNKWFLKNAHISRKNGAFKLLSIQYEVKLRKRTVTGFGAEFLN
jgi:hypothetical protein